MSLSQLDNDLILLRSRLAERERELAAVREAAADAAEAAAWRLEAAHQEAAALRCALDEAGTLGAAVEPEPEQVAEIAAAITVAATTPLPPAPPLPIAPPRRRSLRRVMALPVWRFVRPVARPALWRARSFLAADTLRELAALRAAQDAMQEATRDAIRGAVQEALSRIAPPSNACAEPPCPALGPSHGLGLGDTAAERWLLTVVLEVTAAQPA
ncbi:MAG: hypothetical protein JO157_00700 [Acetobacteraceae bacterium]|nr:hypothetical protein [Acetobacteraceae bacterium]